MKTRSIYSHHLDGIIKTSTGKAILFECSADQTGSVSQRHLQSSTKRVMTWIPRSVCTVQYRGSNAGGIRADRVGHGWPVGIRVPGWMYSKLSWKDADPVAPEDYDGEAW